MINYMKPGMLQILISFIISISFSNIAIGNDNSQNLANKRKLFLSVANELEKNNNNLFYKYKNNLKDYPLYPYLIYLNLYNRINNVSSKEIKEFINTYKDFFLTNQLRDEWLKHQANKQQWNNFLSVYQSSNDVELKCHYINANFKRERKLTLINEINSLWLTDKSQPKACDPVFNAWEKAGFLTNELIWQRIYLAIRHKNYNLAYYLAKKLSEFDEKFVNLWIKLEKNPELLGKKFILHTTHHKMGEVIYNSLNNLAKINPKSAMEYWKIYNDKYNFSDRHLSLFIKNTALSLANNGNDKAIKWLDKIPVEYHDEQFCDVKLRYALKQKNWDYLLKITEKLPGSLSSNEKWLYWQAIALQEKGYKAESQKLLEELAKNRNYYGFLASFRLLKPYNFQAQDIHLNKSSLLSVLKIPEVMRAIEFLKIGKENYANKEWFLALKKMNEEQKQSAAKLAEKLKVPNWSIMALAHAKNKNNLNLRFPTEYSQYVFKAAEKHNIDPAWIFAVTRQESAFMPKAKSRAGAIGLMQIMPSTGKMVAKKENIDISDINDLLIPEKNIKIGSKYLSMMLEKYNNNHVLATAAYNAGPGRIDKWLPSENIEVDAWIETLPFKETRNYVQNILTYTLIYQMILGRHPELKNSLL